MVREDPPGDVAPPRLGPAHGYPQWSWRRSPLEQLGLTAQPGRHFILRGMESAEAWEFLAEIYAHAGDCSGAERAAAKVPRNQVAHDAAEWCKKRK